MPALPWLRGITELPQNLTTAYTRLVTRCSLFRGAAVSRMSSSAGCCVHNTRYVLLALTCLRGITELPQTLTTAYTSLVRYCPFWRGAAVSRMSSSAGYGVHKAGLTLLALTCLRGIKDGLKSFLTTAYTRGVWCCSLFRGAAVSKTSCMSCEWEARWRLSKESQKLEDNLHYITTRGRAATRYN